MNAGFPTFIGASSSRLKMLSWEKDKLRENWSFLWLGLSFGAMNLHPELLLASCSIMMMVTNEGMYPVILMSACWWQSLLSWTELWSHMWVASGHMRECWHWQQVLQIIRLSPLLHNNWGCSWASVAVKSEHNSLWVQKHYCQSS